MITASLSQNSLNKNCRSPYSLPCADLQLSEASEFTKLLKRGLDSDSGAAAPAAASTAMMGDEDDDDMDIAEPAPIQAPPVVPKAENRRFRYVACI